MSNNKNWSDTRLIMQYIIENPSYNTKESLSQWIGNIGQNRDTMLLLVGNKSISEDLIVNKTIQALFDTGIVAPITDEILSKQSIEEIVKGKLFLHIKHIPNSKEEQEKLKDLIISVVIHKSIQSDGYKIPTQAKIIVTIDEPHPFFKDFLDISTTLFIDSKDSILTKCGVTSLTTLYQAIETSLDYYSDEIRAMPKAQLDIRIDENKHYIESLIETSCESSSSEEKGGLPILDSYADNFEKYFPLWEFHTYITGLTRIGKSMFLITLFMKYIQNKKWVTILFDVHGDLGQKAKRLVKDKERLLYISNSLDKSYAASINLFKIYDKSEKSITKMANVILGVIKQIKADESFSGPMEETLLRCIRVLLRKGDGSFSELYRFMNDKRNTDLVKYAKSCGNELDEEYFSDYFNETNTKTALRRRLSTLLSDEDFMNMMSGDKCIDFEKEFNTPGKIIIFDIAKGNMDSYIYYIRFIIEYILVLALKRVNTPKEERVRTHLILDEFDNFMSSNRNIKTIFKEAGKYNLFLTIAHQIISDIKDPSLRDTILSMTDAKVVFKNSNQTLDALNKTLNIKLEDVENLNKGECYISVANNKIIKVKNTTRFLDNTEEISTEEWKEHEQYQLNYNYRHINPETALLPNEDEITQMIQQFKDDIKLVLSSQKSIESSCLIKLKDNAPDKFKEIQSDIKYLDSNKGIPRPRIRQQEINTIFQLSFGFNTSISNRKFIPQLKSKDENDMFNQTDSGTRSLEFTDNGKTQTEQYFYIQW